MSRNDISDLYKRFQSNTPSDWVINNHMFRLKTWNSDVSEIEALIESLIHKTFNLSPIKNKNGDLCGISLLYVDFPDDVDIIRKNILITPSGNVLLKMPRKSSFHTSRTIKTTAPHWTSKSMIKNIFSKYNTDPNTYNLTIDQKITKNVSYPIVRFFQRKIERYGKTIPAVVIYVEFSPQDSSIDDSYVALSMLHRLEIKDEISGEKATLIFENWISDKETLLRIKQKKQENRKEFISDIGKS